MLNNLVPSGLFDKDLTGVGRFPDRLFGFRLTWPPANLCCDCAFVDCV
jgi:hypothetical protein